MNKFKLIMLIAGCYGNMLVLSPNILEPKDRIIAGTVGAGVATAGACMIISDVGAVSLAAAAATPLVIVGAPAVAALGAWSLFTGIGGAVESGIPCVIQ